MFVLRACQILRAFWAVGFVLMLRSAPGVRGVTVCVGLERCCGVSVVCDICGIGCEVR